MRPQVGNRLGPSSDPRYVVLCSSVAVLILLLASINYVNLATARAGRRAREIGVRKAVGAGRDQLVRQLMGESLLLCVLAAVTAVGLAEGAIQLFPHLTGFELPDLQWTVSMILAGATLVTAVGVAAGLYPAWVLSRHQPATVTRGHAAVGRARLRQGLVVVQFVVTAALMTLTLIVWQQLDFIQTRRLGLAPEQVLVVENGALPPDRAQAFKAQLQADSRIEVVSLSQSLPTRGPSRIGFTLDGDYVSLTSYHVDGDFVKAMGLRMKAGRPVTDAPGDAGAIVINEAAAAILGWDEPIGKGFTLNGLERTIVGVVEDFHYESLHRPVEPLYMAPTTDWTSYVAIRVGRGHTRQALQVIEQTWAELAPHYPLRFTFLDQAFARLYDDEQRLARVLTAFFVLAIAIASVGLFGLGAHAAQERTREIGVRKVFGASVASVTGLLSRDFAALVAIAFGISVPLAWWGAHQWLQDFAYHVDLGVGVFVVSGAASLGLALLTVSHQALRAAMADPVRTLRHE